MEPQRKPWPKRFAVYILKIYDEIKMDASGLKKKITGMADGSSGTYDGCNVKQMEDHVLAAIGDNVSKDPVHAATTAALPANTRTANVLTADAVGAFPTIDGVPPVINQYYLVKNEGGGASHINNGIYELTILGDGATEWELTRRHDMEGGEGAAGAMVHADDGTVNADSEFKCINNIGSDIINTDALEFKFWGQVTDHANLKNVTTSQHHVKYTDAEALAAAWDNSDTKNFENLLIDGDFEQSAVSAFWTGFGPTTKVIENVIIKIGTQSVKLGVPAPIPTAAYIYQDVVDYTRYQGREVTLNVWAYCPSGNSFDSLIEIDDGVGVTGSSVIPKDDAWHLISITHTMDAAATQMRAILYLRKTTSISATDIAYFDGCMFVEGDSGVAYGDCSPLYQDITGIFRGAIALAGIIPVDADIATWNIGDRGFGASLAINRQFLIYKDVGGVRYKELATDGIVSIDDGDSPYLLNLHTWTTLLCDAALGAITVDLPIAAKYDGIVYRIKKIDASANAITITPNGIETIDGAASKVLTTQYDCIELLGDGTGWTVLYPTTTLPGDIENGGSKEMNVGGLSGQLADNQPALAHDLAGAKHNADTKANLITKISDVTEIITNNTGEINGFAEKTAPISADLVLIEDSAASNAKKKVQLGNHPLADDEKGGIIASGGFTGTPRKATITFGTAYPDTNYVISVIGEDARNWVIESKLAGSFVINSGSGAAMSGNTFWATKPINNP